MGEIRGFKSHYQERIKICKTSLDFGIKGGGTGGAQEYSRGKKDTNPYNISPIEMRSL